MPATLIDIDLHIVEQICLEKSQRLPVVSNIDGTQKRNDSLMELGDWQTAMGERYIQMLRPAMTRQQT